VSNDFRNILTAYKGNMWFLDYNKVLRPYLINCFLKCVIIYTFGIIIKVFQGNQDILN